MSIGERGTMASAQSLRSGALRAPEPRQGRYEVAQGVNPGRASRRCQSFCLLAVFVALFAVGCRQDMHDQPKLQALEASTFFENGMASRAIPAGTVPWGHLREDTHLYEGKDANGEFVDALPVLLDDDGNNRLALTHELVERGQTRFEIYCSVCHDSTGGGRGMIVRRGFKQPQPLYEQRLKDMPAGYFFDVITAGFGLMSSYKSQIPVEDRWAIVAYIRALQLSQTSVLAELPQGLQSEFQQALSAPVETTAAEEHH